MLIVSTPLHSLLFSPPPSLATFDTDSPPPRPPSFRPLLADGTGRIFRGWYSQTEPRLAQAPQVG